nr:hypothetical protein [bacterium]
MNATSNVYAYFAFLLILIAACGLFGWQLYRRWLPLRQAQSINRFDQPWLRIKGLVTLLLSQRKLLTARFRWSGVVHAMIFFGFLAVLLNTITFLGQGIWSGFELPLFNPDCAIGRGYLLVKEYFQLVVLIAVVIAIIRRLVVKPVRLTLSGEAVLVLFLIAYLMVVDWVFAGAELRHAAETGIWYLPLSTIVGGWLPASQLPLIHSVAFWSHLLVLLLFLNLLPISKHFHVVTSAFSIYFRNLGASKLETLNLEDEEAEHFGNSQLEHFHWKTVLDLYSCTEC